MMIWNLLKFHKIIILLSIFIHFRHLVVTSNVNIFSVIKCSISQLGRRVRCIEIDIVWNIGIGYSWYNIYRITLPFIFPLLITSAISCVLVVFNFIRALFIVIPCFQIHLVDLMRLVFNTRCFIIIILLNSLSINVWINQIIWRCDIWSLLLYILLTWLISVSNHVLSVLRWEDIFCLVFIWWFSSVAYYSFLRMLIIEYLAVVLIFILKFYLRMLLIFDLLFIKQIMITKWWKLFFPLTIHQSLSKLWLQIHINLLWFFLPVIFLFCTWSLI
jgi:hypothetical protein